MQENKKFPHEQLNDLAELDDLTLESFEEAQAEFVTYPEDEDTEFDLEDIDLEEDLEALDDLETFDGLESLALDDDLVDLEENELEDLVDIDELEDMEQEPKPDDRVRQQKVSEAHKTLNSISKMLDSLLQEDAKSVSSKDQAKPKFINQLDREQVIDAEFNEIAAQTDNLDKILSQRKEKSVSDQYVSDLFEHRDWDLVIDEELLEKTEAVINSINNTNETLVKAQGVEKKSFGTLATALLAGGGVLVFGLATAGVVTMFKNLRKAPKYTSAVSEPVMQVKPVSVPKPEPEPEPEPVKQQVVEPEQVEPMQHDNLYRGMPPHYKQPPVGPFWGMAPPPPPYYDNDKDVAL